MTGRVYLVLCCHAEDEKLSKELVRHLAPLEQNGQISLWDPSQVPPGADRKAELLHQLDRADVLLLLTSASFLADCPWAEWCAAATATGRRPSIVPVIGRAALWQIGALAGLSPLPP